MKHQQILDKLAVPFPRILSKHLEALVGLFI